MTIEKLTILSRSVAELESQLSRNRAALRLLEQRRKTMFSVDPVGYLRSIQEQQSKLIDLDEAEELEALSAYKTAHPILGAIKSFCVKHPSKYASQARARMYKAMSEHRDTLERFDFKIETLERDIHNMEIAINNMKKDMA